MTQLNTFLIALSLILSSTAMASGDTDNIDRLTKKEVKAMSADEMADRATVLEARILEINTIDTEALDRSERKALKKETRYIERELGALGKGGIYISTGTLLVIIILILIL